jgi:hypothetical protein
LTHGVLEDGKLVYENLKGSDGVMVAAIAWKDLFSPFFVPTQRYAQRDVPSLRKKDLSNVNICFRS